MLIIRCALLRLLVCARNVFFAPFVSSALWLWEMSLSSRRRIRGYSFAFKCVSVTCVFLILEGAFIVYRWTISNKLSSTELEKMIPLEEGDYKVT